MLPCPCQRRSTLPERCRCTSSVDRGTWSQVLFYPASHFFTFSHAATPCLLFAYCHKVARVKDDFRCNHPTSHSSHDSTCVTLPPGYAPFARLRDIQRLQQCSILQTHRGARLRWNIPSPSMVYNTPSPWSTFTKTSRGTTVATHLLLRPHPSHPPRAEARHLPR